MSSAAHWSSSRAAGVVTLLERFAGDPASRAPIALAAAKRAFLRGERFQGKGE